MSKLNELIEKRRSIVNFSQQSIENEKIELLFEAARWASSSYNEQPWRFIYATSDRHQDQHDKLKSLLLPGNSTWASKAPLLILTVAKKELSRTEKKNTYAWHDVGLAVANLIIQATDMGLYGHQMGGFDKAKATELLNIPPEYEPVSMIAIGYRGDLEDLDESLKPKELKDRTRLSLEEITFVGQWENKN